MSKKEKKAIKNNNSGFTLVELLATISILAIVVAITLYIALTVISRAKEKTYDITRNNIVSNSINYLLERKDELDFEKTLSNIEYKCLTVQNLIDYGYLSNDVTKSQVAENVYVSPQDYIYIERDTTTKAIKFNLFVSSTDEEGSYYNACKVSTIGNNGITMELSPSADTWTRSKDVTITYTLKNIGNISTISKYHYGYSFSDADMTGIDDIYNNRTILKKVTVAKETDVLGFTYYQDGNNQENYKSKTLHISRIDREGPVITLKNNPTGYAVDTLTVKLNVTDTKSGVKPGSFTKSDIVVTVSGHAISNITLGTKDANDNYNLTINNSTYTGAIVISIAASKVEDNVGNLNDAKTFNLNAIWAKATTRPTAPNYCLNPNYSGAVQSIIKAAGTGYSWNGVTTGTDVGTYNVIAKLAEGYVWDNKTTTDITIGCEIKAISATCPTIEGYSGIRDGNSHTINITGGNGGTVKYRTSTTDEWTDVKPTRIDAGTTTVYVEIAGDKNHLTKQCGNVKIVLIAPTPKPTNTPTKTPTKKPNTTTPKPTATKTTTKKPNTTTPKPTATKTTTKKPNTTTPKPTATKTTTKKPNTTTPKPTATKTTTKKPNTTTPKPTTRRPTTPRPTTRKPTTMRPTTRKPNTTTPRPTATNTTTKKPNTTTPKPTTTVAPTTSGGGATIIDSGGGCKGSYNGKVECSNGTIASAVCTRKVVEQSSKCPNARSVRKEEVCKTTCTASCGSASSIERIQILERCPVITTSAATTTKKATNTTTKKPNTTTKKPASCASISNASECAAAGCAWNYNYGCSNKVAATTTKKPNTTTPRPTNTPTPRPTTRKPTPLPRITKPTGGCFLAGTLVMTNYGYKEINKLAVGDIVLSYNTETNSNEYQPVTKVFIHKDMSDSLYTLTIDDTTIEVTSLHRFYIKSNKGTSWKAAKDLRINDYVKYADGTYHKITKITHKRIKETVYNLEVLDNHNYYVYENGVLVHNAKALLF